MGFGGGSFDSGGGGDFGGGSFDSYSSSDSYSGFDGGGGGGECTKQEASVFFSVFFGLGFVISCLFLTGWPPAELHYCVNGQSLNPKEQIWCTPNEISTVRTDSFSSSISVYRLKKSDLPEKVFRSDEQHESLSVNSNSYKYYSFVMMPEGRVTGTINSTDSSDRCYLMDYENYLKFIDRKNFKALTEGRGYLNATFEATVPDNYYFVVYHPGDGTVTARFDLSFNYSVYPVFGLKADPCSSEGDCTFENVGPDEIIIADSNSQVEQRFHLLLPDELDVSTAAIHIMIIVVTGSLMIGFISVSVYLCYFAGKKNSTEEEDSVPLMETEKTPNSSTETSTDDEIKDEKTSEPQPTIPYLENLPSYDA